MKDNLFALTTEERNPNSMNIGKMSIEESVIMMNKEDENCISAVRNEIPSITKVIECCVETISNDGKVYFIGAAHSGYLGILDVYEANATFGCTNEFIPMIAGRFTDMMKTEGGAEDDFNQAEKDLIEIGVNKNDFVIGLSASGRTPYVVGAVKYLKGKNIKTACIVNNKNTIVSSYVTYPIEAVAGPEVISGSTRLKSGTCQKMILNMITTITMARLGRTYSNLMINVPPISNKMCQRLEYIMQQATDCTQKRAKELLELSEYNIKLALTMELNKCDLNKAKEELIKCGGNLNNLL